jgi:hypothetical protein
MADVWLSNPDRWWRDTVDLIVFGLEAMQERRRGRSRAGGRTTERRNHRGSQSV